MTTESELLRIASNRLARQGKMKLAGAVVRLRERNSAHNNGKGDNTMPARKKASASALPQSSSIPKGMKQMGGGYAPTWKPEKPGEALHGKVHAPVKIVEFKQKRKVKGKMVEETVERRVCEVADSDAKRHALWESAALVELFDALAELGDDAVGTEVFVQYDGLGKKKAGQNAPKLFTVAMAA